MSMKEIIIRKRKLLIIAGSLVWLAACSQAWHVGNIGGGDTEQEASRIISEVNANYVLSPACLKKELTLVTVGLKARNAAWMPTYRTFAAQEIAAGNEFVMYGCPINVLPSITFSLAEYGNKLEKIRSKNRSETW